MRTAHGIILQNCLIKVSTLPGAFVNNVTLSNFCGSLSLVSLFFLYIKVLDIWHEFILSSSGNDSLIYGI